MLINCIYLRMYNLISFDRDMNLWHHHNPDDRICHGIYYLLPYYNLSLPCPPLQVTIVLCFTIEAITFLIYMFGVKLFTVFFF